MKLGKRKRNPPRNKSSRKKRKAEYIFETNTSAPVDFSVKTRIVVTSEQKRFQSEFVSKLNKILSSYCSPLFDSHRLDFYRYFESSSHGLFIKTNEEESEFKRNHNEKVMKEFTESFLSLYKLFHQGSIPFFYFISKPHLHILFLSGCVHGDKKVNMIVRYGSDYHNEILEVLENRNIYYFPKYPPINVLKMDVYSKIHHFVDYLLNDYVPEIVLNPKFNPPNSQNSTIPVLYSPIPFMNSLNKVISMKNHQIVRIGERKRIKEKKQSEKLLHIIEFEGIILPHTLNNILQDLVDKTIPFKITEIETIEETKVFNMYRVKNSQSQYEDEFWNRHYKLEQKVPMKWKDDRIFRNFLLDSEVFRSSMSIKFFESVSFAGSSIVIEFGEPKKFLVDDDEEEEEEED